MVRDNKLIGAGLQTLLTDDENATLTIGEKAFDHDEILKMRNHVVAILNFFEQVAVARRDNIGDAKMIDTYIGVAIWTIIMLSAHSWLNGKTRKPDGHGYRWTSPRLNTGVVALMAPEKQYDDITLVSLEASAVAGSLTRIDHQRGAGGRADERSLLFFP